MSATGMMLPGDGSNPPDNDNLDDAKDQQGTATQMSAYVAPTDGQPTICQNCVHFDGQGSCDHPEVIADPKVLGRVDPNGHSKFYASGSPTTGGDGILGLGGKTAPKGQGPAGLGAGARFPTQSNTPNYQGD